MRPPFGFTQQGPLSPTISSLSISQGYKGDTLVISGTNYDNASVRIGTSNALITANTSTSLTMIVPPGVGTADVTVTTPAGSVTSTGAFSYLLFKADFSALALGAMSALNFYNATGLTFSRTTKSTVQVSSDSLVKTVAIDEAAIGSPDGTKKGLVIQQKTRNIGGGPGDDAPRNLSVTWTNGTAATVTPNYQAGPDGITPNVGSGILGCTRVSGASGTYGPYGSTAILNTTTPVCFSAWERSTNAAGGGGNMQMGANPNSINANAKATIRSASDTWARMTLLKGATLENAITTVDCRDYTVVSGATAQARDVLVDYVMFELGNFPTEATETGLTNRGADTVVHGALPSLYSSGRMRAYFAFYPKHASTDVPVCNDGTNSTSADKYYLLAKDSNTYVRIDVATMKVEIKTSAVSFHTSTNAMSWAAQDLVEIFIEMGSSATNIWYRLNSAGAWNVLTSAGSSLAALSATGAAYIGKVDTDYGTGSINTGSMCCWMKEVRFYPSTGYPSGLP